ncbi:methylenetetrahydrofolate reductase [Paeniglutamicibacter cryotolerans]|uniref:Methylenetetrahydrofolate reductase n=1 Tax=Paeniglutamicibacter cryotolerans TaxID=670079 RepID=A0A839QM70_9MICC|nr:methylenetetrahydrofolate reductase [Paeniglutamicibacter cryotolerans]MBB2995844.1 5,10-methylenetetrahydrofolate reductase [Paeniglutamicibacter cryotolerans]
MSMTLSTALPSLSYELYPPASAAAAEDAHHSIVELESTDPDYVSVTYSGTEARRKASLELIGHLINNTRLRPLAHLTCVGEDRASLESLVQHFVSIGVRGVPALRGDLPREPGAWRRELPFARYLVELIRDVEARNTAALGAGRLAIGVAAYPMRHPESPSFEHDVEVLLAKERSGADFAITQVYFDPLDYTGLGVAASKAEV